MICDNCAWNQRCTDKQKQGRHRETCEDYFPDLTHAKPQNPGRYATLERRLLLKRKEN